MVSDHVTCDDILIFDDEVVVTQKLLNKEMIVAEMGADEWYTKKEKEEEDGQEAEVPLMEKMSASPIREALNALFNFALTTSNKKM